MVQIDYLLNGNYTISGNTNEFSDDIIGMISALESNYGTDALTNLTTNLTKIFPINPSESQKNNAVAAFKSACKRKTINTVKNNTSNGSSYTVDNIAWENLKDDTNGSIRRNIYTYYEYVQFKRAHFKCDDVTYNQETGRITRMDFSFTGEFN